MNRPVPEVATEVEETDVVNNGIDIGEITRGEIKSALGDMKSGKAPGIDSDEDQRKQQQRSFNRWAGSRGRGQL